MNENLATIARLTDRLDNLLHALDLPIPDRMHVDLLRQILPGLRDEIRTAVIIETNENPWRTYDDATDKC